MTIAAINYDSQQANRLHIIASLKSIRQKLEVFISRLQTENFSPPPSLSHSPLQKLCHTFNLSDFERDVLLLCAGMELEPEWGELCAEAQGNPKLNFPTLNLALMVLDNPCWDALTPEASLRRQRLIEVGDNAGILTTAPLLINERILHFLMGASHLDEQLLEILELVNPTPKDGFLVESHQELAKAIATTWQQSSSDILPVIQLCGDETASKKLIAATACKAINLNLYVISAQNIPANTSDFHQFLRLWRREALLSNSALLLHCDNISTNDTAIENQIKSLIERITSPLIITTRDRLPPRERTIVTFDIRKPTSDEQKSLWQKALSKYQTQLNPETTDFIDTLVCQFNLTAPEIYGACAKCMDTTYRVSTKLPILLWESCRAQARPKLDDLAQRIIPSATWDDIVLPETQFHTLRTVAAHVRQRTKVYQNWGFAGKGGRGLGISALFAGVSGTGKTMSAEVLAQELQLDLYRIDLSAVVSKYIGETEKNLRRVFDAAEAGATILLFDEADALFGKRSDVKDSHDRYANMEVSYLLQRMEEYQGLAILTTNLKDSIDTAFLRRIRFVIKYSFPDASQREEIWRRIFPKDTPTQELDYTKLAKLNVAGGNIRNIALNAAFLAADAGEAVGMKHLKSAAQSEYVKLERTLTDAEVRGWT